MSPSATISSLRRFGPAALALASISCAALLGARVRRPSDDPIRVPHARHAKASVECLVCHEPVYDATTLEGDFLPTEGKCLECHREHKEKGKCSFCHTDVKRAGPFVKREPRLRMSHAKHIELVKEDCSRCHEKLPQGVAQPTGTLRPTMASCLECHNHAVEYRQGKCSVCHIDLSHFPLRPVSDFTHEGNFIREHARIARGSEAACGDCHDQIFCSDCHSRTATPRIEVKFPERVTADFIHRNDFMSRHALEAQLDPPLCQRCHAPSYCVNCHEVQNLVPTAQNARDPHPPGWSLPGSPNFHGPTARRDIVSCAACHDQGPRTNCIDCHKVGGIGGNPHPIGWLDRHRPEEIRQNSVCLYCHN